MANVSAGLKENGVFILEMTNRDAVAVSEIETKVSYEGGVMVLKQNTFDARTSRRRLDWSFIENDQVVKRVALEHRLYSLHELIHLFQGVGLHVEDVFQEMHCTPFKPGARKLVLVGRKSKRLQLPATV